MSEVSAPLRGTHTNQSASVRNGLVAGLVAGILIEVYLFATGVAHWPVVYQWIASTIVGKAAFTQTESVWLGLAMHVAISLFWGVVYALAALRLSSLTRAPMAAGAVFGVIVYASMQLALAVTGNFAAAGPLQLLNAVVAHVVFFGIPIAWYVKSTERTAKPQRRNSPQSG